MLEIMEPPSVFCSCIVKRKISQNPLKTQPTTGSKKRAAGELRERPEASVTDVAFGNWFNSSQYFAPCFRRRFNISPSQLVLNQDPAKNGQ
jgi:AraC-like DNA-binding protein